MKRLSILALSALLGLLAPACGGGGTDGLSIIEIPEFVALSGCMLGGLEDADQMVEGVGGVIDSVTFDPETGAFSIAFSDFQIDGTIVGDGIDDGLDVGESATASYNIAGSFTGNGTLTFTLVAADRLDIVGFINGSDGDCTLSFTNIDVTGDPSQPDFVLSGSAEFIATNEDPASLTGTITFDGSSTARVNGTLNDETSVSFSINLDDFSFRFN